ncbi:MAG: hypothetical protein ACOZNI_17200 [Myxococcota bacterium]
MRIRKLAQALDSEPEAVLRLLAELGHGRYTDAEQQVPADVEAQVRRHARNLPKASPKVPQKAIVRQSAETDPELALLSRELAGVRPLGAAPPRVSRSSMEVRQNARTLPEPGRPPPDPAEQLRKLEAQVASLRAKLESVEAIRSGLQSERDELAERLDEAEARVATLLRRERAKPASLREVFERRGLRGEDEVALALRLLIEARRDRELLPHLVVPDPEALEEVLWSRLTLVGEGEEAPAGLLPVRVPPERSEGLKSPRVRAAMVRFSSVCLVNDTRRVLIVGGLPAYHRALREGVDPRIELRLVPYSRRATIPEPGDADRVFVWAPADPGLAARWPNATVVSQRDLVALLDAAAAAIEKR